MDGAMTTRQQVQNIPRALRETLEKGRAEYESVIRRTRWNEGPILLCACGESFSLSLAGVYAFESLLGWPVLVRPASVFEHYSLPVLQPRSVVLMVSASGRADEVSEPMRIARAKGATLLALTNSPASPLAEGADGVFLTRAGEEASNSPSMAVCQHTALTYIALTAARILRRPAPLWDSLEEEFSGLAAGVEWAFTQLADATRSLAAELKGSREGWVIGGGFWHPVALFAARRLRELAGTRAEGIEVSEFGVGPARNLRPQEAALFLSGSRSKLKKAIHNAVALANSKGAKILSITDSNDRELSSRCDLAVLGPVRHEMAASAFTLALLEWLGAHLSRDLRLAEEQKGGIAGRAGEYGQPAGKE